MNLLEEGLENGTVRETGQSTKHTIDGRTRIFPVYEIRIDQLYYNNHNDRIATWLSAYRAENDGKDPIELPRDEYNEIIENYIVESNTEAIRSTEKNIESFGQRVPGVVLSDGLVVDGNRRLTCIRRIAAKNKETGWFEAVILDDTIAADQKRIKMLELTIQHGEEGKTDYDPIERLVGVYNDIIKNCLLTKSEYAKSTGMKEADVDKLIEQAGYMREFLEFAGAPEQYHLARELSINGPLVEMGAILRKCGSENEKEQVKRFIFANILAQPEGDLTRFIRKFKRIVGTDQAPSFYGDEQTALLRLVPLLGKGSTTKARIQSIRGNQDLVDQFKRAMEKADSQVKVGRIANAPISKTREALTGLNQVIPSMLQKMNAHDRAEVKNTLVSIIEKANSIINEIDSLD